MVDLAVEHIISIPSFLMYSALSLSLPTLDCQAGLAAVAVRPMASAYLRYVSTDAITTRASTESSSMPTKETLAHASITMPLSRIRSTTSARLELSVDFITFAMARRSQLLVLNCL